MIDIPPSNISLNDPIVRKRKSTYVWGWGGGGAGVRGQKVLGEGRGGEGSICSKKKMSEDKIKTQHFFHIKNERNYFIHFLHLEKKKATGPHLWLG